MATKIKKHPNDYISIMGCPRCDNAPYLWFDKGEWIIDTDDGLRGPIVKYCPNCGFELFSIEIAKRRDG